MRPTLNQLKEEALGLPAQERAQLATSLLHSLDEGTPESEEAVARAWEEEIDRRVRQIVQGAVQGVPAEQVFAEMRAMLRKKPQ